MIYFAIPFYILDKEGNITLTHDLHEWVKWYSDMSNRRVGYTDLGEKGTIYTTFISTMRLDGVPAEWETMYVSVNGSEKRFWSYKTLEDARKGHERIVEMVKKGKVE